MFVIERQGKGGNNQLHMELLWNPKLINLTVWSMFPLEEILIVLGFMSLYTRHDSKSHC